MAALLTNATTNGAGTGSAQTGPSTVYVRGNFGGARVVIQVADENVAASYVKPDRSVLRESVLSGPSALTLNANGAYFVRAVVTDAGPSTSITAIVLP